MEELKKIKTEDIIAELHRRFRKKPYKFLNAYNDLRATLLEETEDRLVQMETLVNNHIPHMVEDISGLKKSFKQLLKNK
jgi:hypothetical protein|tara:strand:+ start:84 stop:320 length:237 start_codon:yes stop_codon:yes gene_type:complete